jgi:hypothetical protein
MPEEFIVVEWLTIERTENGTVKNKLFYFCPPHLRFFYDEEKRNKRRRKNIRRVPAHMEK